jgi:plasmid stability protein
MPVLTVRNVSDEVHRALKLRAAQNGRSAEAEVRAILEATVLPEERVDLVAELIEFGKLLGGLELDITRDPTPAEPAIFD